MIASEKTIVQYLPLVKSALKHNLPLLVEIGSTVKREGWITIDCYDEPDIKIDMLKEGIPFPDNSVDMIYSQHFLEHFSYPEEMNALFGECLRVLKKGAVFSACVPNARIYIDAYLSQAPGYFRGKVLHPPAWHYNSPIDYINYMAYLGGGHKHMFDMDNLKAVLSVGGFTDVKEREFIPGLDAEHRRWESIYVECKA